MDENTLGRMLYDLNNRVQEINTKVTDLKVKIGNREEEIIKAIDKDAEARLNAEPDANMRIRINNVRDSKVKQALEYDDEIRGLKKNVDDLMKKHNRLWEQHEILIDLKNLYIDYNNHLPIYDKNSYTYYYGNKSYDDVFKQRVEEFVKEGKDLGISFNLEKINNEGTDSFTTSDKNVSMTDNIPSNNTQDDLKNSFDNQFSNEIGVGGKHFKPNQTDAEYATFKKDGTLHLVGNFSEDWFRENYQKLVGDLITDDVKKVTCWNKLDYGVTPLAGLDVKVEVSSDGIEIIGDVEDLNIYTLIDNNPASNLAVNNTLEFYQKLKTIGLKVPVKKTSLIGYKALADVIAENLKDNNIMYQNFNSTNFTADVMNIMFPSSIVESSPVCIMIKEFNTAVDNSALSHADNAGVFDPSFDSNNYNPCNIIVN